MKPEISSRKDIKKIITNFYHLLLADSNMLPFFIDIVNEKHLEKHLEDITDFWSDILFDTNIYSQNVMQKHTEKNRFITFKNEHFKIWMSYFFKSIDTDFEGVKAQDMKNRATSIATVMQLKLATHQKK